MYIYTIKADGDQLHKYVSQRFIYKFSDPKALVLKCHIAYALHIPFSMHQTIDNGVGTSSAKSNGAF